MSDIVLKQPGVQSAVAFPGLSINGFTNSSNAGIVFATLKPFDERKSPDLSGLAIAGQLNQKFGAIKDAFIAIFPPPSVQGLGTIGGFKLQIEDRGGLGYEALDQAIKAFVGKASQTPEIAGLFSSFQINVPQLYADVDRVKARQLGVAVTGRVRDHADLSGLALRQRLQQVRPHLLGARAGRRQVSCPGRGRGPAEGALANRRDGAAGRPAAG